MDRGEQPSLLEGLEVLNALTNGHCWPILQYCNRVARSRNHEAQIRARLHGITGLVGRVCDVSQQCHSVPARSPAHVRGLHLLPTVTSAQVALASLAKHNCGLQHRHSLCTKKAYSCHKQDDTANHRRRPHPDCSITKCVAPATDGRRWGSGWLRRCCCAGWSRRLLAGFSSSRP